MCLNFDIIGQVGRMFTLCSYNSVIIILNANAKIRRNKLDGTGIKKAGKSAKMR
ncbi:hypothetical protein SDC9_79726 [bioreactor metagenome]|uniref:Uncharacterized protein n=1 Tax=bioreactor metagenome TaxID=1076179 RepID=A0A644YXQ8_9ZZZZ